MKARRARPEDVRRKLTHLAAKTRQGLALLNRAPGFRSPRRGLPGLFYAWAEFANYAFYS